jgi:hypothetical protein
MRKIIKETEHKKYDHYPVTHQLMNKNHEGSNSESPSVLGLGGVFAGV